MGLRFKTTRSTTLLLKQCQERGIRVDDVVHVAETGEVIREYPDEVPYPCFLLLGWVAHKPLHVLAALDAANELGIMVTAYWPDPSIWEPDFKRKRT